jgi:hypothetical protein
MEFKKTIKRIVALGTGASMVGATLFGALAQADLAQYPSQYIKSGAFTGVLVVGDTAAAQDVIGVSDIAVSLQFAATKPVTVVNSGGSVAEGDAWQVATSTKHLELSEANKETLRNITKSISSAELDALASGTITNTKGDAPFNQYLDLLGPGVTDNTGYVKYAEDDDDVTADFLFFGSGKEMAKYKLEFTTALESDVDDSAGSALATGLYLSDFDDVALDMFGKTYTVVTARRPSATTNGGNGIDLTLMSGAVKDTMLEGTTKTYTIEGKDYEVTLDFVSSTQSKFTINGEATRLMKDGETDKLSDGTEVGVTEILYQDYAGGVHSSTFFLGAQKVELKDTNVVDAVSSDNLKIGEDTIDNAYVVIEGTNDNSTFKLSRITVNMTADDDFYVPAGGKLSENPGLDEPQVLFTQNWDYEYRGLTTEEIETIELDTSGSSKYQLKFKDGSGNAVTVPIAKATTTGTGLRMGGDTGDENFINNEAVNISKDDYFVLTDSGQKRGERNTFIYQYKGSTKSTSDSPVLKFKDLGTGNTFEQSYTAGSSPLATLKAGGADYSVYLATSGDVTANDFAIQVDMDASGALGTDPTLNGVVLLTTYSGMEINLTNTTANSGVPVIFHVPDSAIDGGAADKEETLLATDYKINITASSGKVALTRLSSPTELTPQGESNVQYSYNSYGSFITRNSPSSEPGTLKIENPMNQRYAQVFITTQGTTFSDTTAATTDAVTVQRIDVGATKLASEVPNIEAVSSILVGGPCANSAAADVMGNPADCTEGFEPGVGIIKMYEVGTGNVAMLVAGYSADDTRNAAAVVANYKDYATTFKGAAVEVKKVANVLTVAEPKPVTTTTTTTTTTTEETTTTE